MNVDRLSTRHGAPLGPPGDWSVFRRENVFGEKVAGREHGPVPFRRPIVLALAVTVLAGCGGYEPAPPDAPAPATQPAEIAPPPAPVQEPPKTLLKKAEKGVGKKGRGYGRGPVATPIASYFSMRERIAFEIQLPKAMQLFKADKGRAPNSHEEFMEKIIKASQINLPQLPEGERYLYDPATEQLMVEHPAPQ